MTEKSALQQARAAYQPKLPKALQGPVKVKEGEPTQSVDNQEEIKKLFPNTYGMPVVEFVPGTGVAEGRFNVGVILSGGYFEHYGYMLRVSYDCMMEKDTGILSCTSSFDKDGSTNYPDGENLRVVATGLKAGEWQHVEGYMTMYSDMDPGTFKIYWESAGNTDDIFLDNVKVQILYTMPAGRFADQ